MNESHPNKSQPLLTRREKGFPPNIGWVRTGIGVGALGYCALFTYSLFFKRVMHDESTQEGVTALLLCIAFVLSHRRPVGATILGLSAVLCEILLSFFVSKSLVMSSLGAFPVLIIMTAMLFGPQGAIGMAIVCGVGVPLTMYLSGAWGPNLSGYDTAIQGNALIVTEVIIIVTALLISAALKSYYRAHNESERLRRRYMDLFQNAPDGLIVLDDELRVVEANPAAVQIMGIEQENLIGAVLSKAMQLAGAKESLDVHALGTGVPLSVLLLKENGKERMLEITSRFEAGPDAPTFLIMRDVSVRRAFEERLDHAQRLESVGRLAGGVAHDFNNLLTVVSGNASVLIAHSDPEVSAQARDIMEAGERGANLTRQLLAFARRDIHRPVVLDLSLALTSMTRLLERLLGEQHRLEISFDRSVAVLADLTQLEQIVMNLTSNARDAMQSGGVVRIAVRALSLPQALELGSTLEVSRQAMLEVADTGTGLSPEAKARLFEPFFTTKPRGRGTGLGLASVHGIVAQSSGSISVDTELGQGTRFRVFLPLVQGTPQAAARPLSPAPASDGGNEHILLVEDEASVRALGVRILTRAGYRVSEAANAEEALFMASSNSDFVLLVSDIVMPGMSGPQLAARIRDRLPKLKVLFMSGHSEADMESATDIDAHRNLLTKPFNSEDLLRRVRTELDRQW